ncbi:MAG: DUF3416 domain-containing protein [Candidatus Omnitrophica bacterium]|nr:DUF3416 domain-containing protein [Candidatus Omnitrophota bacterium]
MVIEGVQPEVDGGRFPIKRIAGDEVAVEADLFADGHEPVAGALLFRHESQRKWKEAPLRPLVNDRFRASFPVKELGGYRYTLEGWVDRPGGRPAAARYEKELRVVVDREKARFSAWYELFPRSWGATPGRHGSFRELEQRLGYVRDLGFDVLYFPPIHPISRVLRKGKNNALAAGPGEPGSPWGIGAREGGHKAVHPELGTLEDFRRVVGKAKQMGLEVALDVALQCSPEHPYVKEHPGWFRRRPDGTIRHAENPPKKYEDIVPFDFECARRKELWEEMKGIFSFWIGQGVRIFRVDNPHTKPFDFWEWLIAEVKRDHPDVILLSEAFTRPKVMMRLAKLGFTQSYTYFCWRNTRAELAGYFTELTQGPAREFFRPSVWTNTPDILTAYLQQGGQPAFRARLVLAATLAASYGIYGPAFELCEDQPREPGSEEYLNSEKYEIKRWELDRPDSLKGLIARVNRIRRENPALQRDDGLLFHPTDNEQILCYSKHSPDRKSRILVAVNLDPRRAQSGWVELQLEPLGLASAGPFEVEDLLHGRRYRWQGARNYLEITPEMTAHIFRVSG